MPENALLAQLRDIHLPTPFFSGVVVWGIIALLCFLGALLVVYVFYRGYKSRALQREAMACLKAYEKEYRQKKNTAKTCAQISELLRRVALAYFPGESVASLQGTAWIDFLSSKVSGLSFHSVSDEILLWPYQKDQSQMRDLQPLFKQVQAFILRRDVPCSK
ncbi:MAG: DUF4381 domain-containing protein [Legionellaceae bacterium]|nr:DUF4381 domain-containing protein [Legionellaceae bacterium]